MSPIASDAGLLADASCLDDLDAGRPKPGHDG